MPTAFTIDKSRSLTAKPTGPENMATAREGSDHAVVRTPVRGGWLEASDAVMSAPSST